MVIEQAHWTLIHVLYQLPHHRLSSANCFQTSDPVRRIHNDYALHVRLILLASSGILGARKPFGHIQFKSHRFGSFITKSCATRHIVEVLGKMLKLDIATIYLRLALTERLS